jgi:hypothetical protein
MSMPLSSRQQARWSGRPGIWTAQAVIFGVWTVFLLVVLARAYWKPNVHSVYPIFANAARQWQQGVDIYDLALSPQHLDKFRYPPPAVLAFLPFAALPDAIGGVLWRLVNIAVFFAGLASFLQSVFPGRENLNRITKFALACLLFPLSIGSLNNGQPNILILGCLMLGAAATMNQRWQLAAICLAVPVLFKIYPVAVVALILLVEPRLGWRVGLLILLSCLLPFAVHDPSSVTRDYQSWMNQVAHDNRHVGTLENSYHDFHVLARFVGYSISEEIYRVLQLAMAVVAAGVVWHGRRLGWRKPVLLRAAFDLGLCWIILFGPATENSTYALLAPTLALAAWDAHQTGQSAWRRWWMTATLSVFVLAVVVTATPLGKSASFYLMPLGALLLFSERLVSFFAEGGNLPLSPRLRASA